MRTVANYPINRRILVIDDNQDIHADFRKTLGAPSQRDPGMDAAEAALFGTQAAMASRSEAGFELDDAFQGKEGLAMVEKACADGKPYAIAFVDMRMPPGWDGMETIGHLWTADPDLQIVICTAYSDYSWQEIFARVGASDRLLIVKKPFDAMEIVQLAHALSEKWSLAHEVNRRVDRLEVAVQERTRDLSVTNLRLVESITEHQQSAQALRRSEERFRAIVDTAHSAIAIVDAYGGIELWNPGAERIFGWTSAEAVGQPLTLVLPELLANDLRMRLEQLLAVEDAPHTDIRITGRHRAGREFPVEISLAAWDSDKGHCFSCIMQDISLRQQAESEILSARDAAEAARVAAESATSAKSSFLASMSHEIRTPMTGIIGMADLLLDTSLDPQQRDFAGTVRSCASSLLSLINDVLDFSQIEAGHLAIEHIDFELRSVVEDAVALFTHMARQRRLDLVAMVDAAAPVMVAGDPTRLRQVLVNLLGNAIKFTSQGEVLLKILVVGTQDDRVRLRCEVVDSGIGIPAEAVDRLFQSFSQADTSISRRYGGTGLGLAICKRLVEAMGGEIGCRSQPGKGSTFHFSLELQVRPRPQPAEEVELAGLRVLCVDDSANTRTTVQKFLASQHIYCDTAPSGTRALDLLRAAGAAGQPYGMLLLDLHMPDMDGLALARTVNADPALAAIPMLMLSNFAQRGQGGAARAAGILGYLTKPVQNALLLATMRLVVGNRRSGKVSLITQHTITEQERLARPQVLVADNDDASRKATCLLLRQLGCRADTVDGGQRAVEAILVNRYDLAFIDGQLADLDGLEVAWAVRQQEPTTRHTPLIFFTARTPDSVRDRCLAAGIDDVIAKPAGLHELTALLARWLSAVDGRLLRGEIPEGPRLIDDAILAEAARTDGGERAALLASCPQLSHGVMDTIVAIAKADPVSLEHAAGDLRNLCEHIGALQLAIHAEELQACGRTRDLAKAAQQITPLQQAWNATEIWLQQRLAGG